MACVPTELTSVYDRFQCLNGHTDTQTDRQTTSTEDIRSLCLAYATLISSDFRLLHYLRINKLQLFYCSLSVYLLLFTTSYYLRSPILWSVFISLVSHFQSHQ